MEKIITILAIVSFALTSVYVLSVEVGPISEEKAIEISRNTEAVQKAFDLEAPYRVGPPAIHVDYWNATLIESLKREHPKAVEWENLPVDHGVWRVHWVFLSPSILHFIDELSGKILYEGVYWFA